MCHWQCPLAAQPISLPNASAPAGINSRSPLEMLVTAATISHAPVHGNEKINQKRAKRTHDDTRPNGDNNISAENVIEQIIFQYESIVKMQIYLHLTILFNFITDSAEKVLFAKNIAKIGMLLISFRTTLRSYCFVSIFTPLDITRSFLQCNTLTYSEQKYIVSEKITIRFYHQSNCSFYYVVVDIIDFDEFQVFTFMYLPQTTHRFTNYS